MDESRAYIIHADVCHDLVPSAQSIHSFDGSAWEI